MLPKWDRICHFIYWRSCFCWILWPHCRNAKETVSLINEKLSLRFHNSDMPSNVIDKNKMVKKKYIQSMQLRFTKRSVLQHKGLKIYINVKSSEKLSIDFQFSIKHLPRGDLMVSYQHGMDSTRNVFAFITDIQQLFQLWLSVNLVIR